MPPFLLGLLPYGLAIVVALGAAAGVYFKGFANGSASRNGEIVDLRTAISRSESAAKEANDRAEKASAQVQVEYRDRIKVVTKEAETRTELVEVIKRETDPNCVLPPAYRELWDGPAKPAGSPKAQDSARTPPAPVAVADAAAAAAEAKRRFEENAAKLEALQNYLSQIQDAKPPT